MSVREWRSNGYTSDSILEQLNVREFTLRDVLGAEDVLLLLLLGLCNHCRVTTTWPALIINNCTVVFRFKKQLNVKKA
jgi:hypothetical protein